VLDGVPVPRVPVQLEKRLGEGPETAEVVEALLANPLPEDRFFVSFLSVIELRNCQRIND
jgi:hypothetical protein